MKHTNLLIAITFTFAACVKERECECKYMNVKYYAGKIEASKQGAKKHCESLSRGDTTCYLK